jgi:NAD(P)-dependent dehydrogenase (short-subunit alcohol dehydrogenase family)
MSPSFSNQVIIITSAGSGIGHAIAIKLSHLGATLALSDINPTSLS